MEAHAAAPATTLELEVESGPMAGQRLSLVGEQRFGSAEEGAATLNDPWLSPSHAAFLPSPDGWVVQDLRWIEGTRVSGRAVRGAAPVTAGDTIELGSTRLVVLPDGMSSLADTPARRAERAATQLRTENRRTLDSRRLVAVLLDLLIVIPVIRLLMDYAGETMASTIAAVAAELTYFFLAESLTGQTLGKRLLGLRVARLDGRPLTPQAVAARTLLRLVEMNPIGLIAMVASGRRRQRFGDLAAGTVVTRASFAPEKAEMRGSNLLALIAYPIVWLAPAVLFFVFMPAARAESCDDAGITTDAQREGTCIDGDGRVYTIVDAGHTLHMRGYDARLTRTAIRFARIPELARHGFPGGDAAVLGFKVIIENTGDKPLRVDRRGDFALYNLMDPSGRTRHIGELPLRFRAGFRPLGSDRRPVRPGATRRGWLRFVVPEVVVGRLPLTNASLGLGLPSHEDHDRYMGQFRLYRAANVKGASALVPLKR